MLTEFKKIEELFAQIEKAMNSKTRLFIIGGAALMYQGLKTATKDIDIIVKTRKEFLEFQKTLVNIGFETRIPDKGYHRMNLSQIFQKQDYRIDLFENEVCGKLSLTEQMMQRAKIVLNLEKLEISLCSNEDILLFKTITEREGDLDDCISLARTGLHWNVILEELQNQIQNSKQDVWITWIGERFDILEDRGLTIPIMKDVNRLRDIYFKSLYNKTKIKKNKKIKRFTNNNLFRLWSVRRQLL